MDERDVSAALMSPWSVGVGQKFHGSPTNSYHRQMQTLAALAPEATAFLDVSALRAATFAMAARHGSFNNRLHPTIFSQSTRFPMKTPHRPCLWLHTHGLLRCGSIELEMSEVSPEDLPFMGDLLNATASFFMDQGVPPAGENVSNRGTSESLLATLGKEDRMLRSLSARRAPPTVMLNTLPPLRLSPHSQSRSPP